MRPKADMAPAAKPESRSRAEQRVRPAGRRPRRGGNTSPPARDHLPGFRQPRAENAPDD